MSVLEGIAAMLPIGLLLIPRMGIIGSMITFIAGYAIVALCGPVYAIIYWKRIPRSLSEWVTIPADFGASDDERFDASIHSLEDAVSIAEGFRWRCFHKRVPAHHRERRHLGAAMENLFW